MKETIKTVLYSWLEKKLPPVVSRGINLARYLDMRPRKIIVVTGFRRVGKTYLLFQLLGKLLREYNREEVVYINFDDERIPEKTEFLTALLPTIRQTFSVDTKILFLDEIQNMPNWSKWLRRIYDNEPVELFVTGSSSKVSSREIPTELRGRCLEVSVYPLSFEEYLKFKELSIDFDIVHYSEKETVKLGKSLDEYIRYGGMPEVVLASEDKKFDLLQQYYGTVVRRDIIERFRVKNEEGLKALLRLLLNSTQYSISRLYNTLKSIGYQMGKTTLLNYISYAESSYFMYSMPIFSPKVKAQLQYPRKIYFIDSGFINALSTRFSNNIGRLYENLVAIELLRRFSKKNIELYYWRNRRGKEVDFVLKDETKVYQLIQVCHDIGHYDTKKREMDSLLRASEELHCKNLLVITGDYEATEKLKNKTIIYMPLWKWLTKKKSGTCYPDRTKYFSQYIS